MEPKNKYGSIRVGLALIFLGGIFLIWQLVPNISKYFENISGPALALLFVALILAVIGIATGAAGMAIPVCIVGGIGAIFYWQSIADDGYLSWAYMWTLIPGFVGLGIIFQKILQGCPWRGISEGFWAIVVSVVLFLVFAAAFGKLAILGAYWPALLILLGLIMIIRPFFKRS